MGCMNQTSSKPFGPIRDAYAFFQKQATETEADIRAYLPHIGGLGKALCACWISGAAMVALPPPCSATCAYLLSACGSPSWSLVSIDGIRPSHISAEDRRN